MTQNSLDLDILRLAYSMAVAERYKFEDEMKTITSLSHEKNQSHHRAWAWRSFWGFQSESKMI
jgi:hypothetical protein